MQKGLFNFNVKLSFCLDLFLFGGLNLNLLDFPSFYSMHYFDL